MISAQDRKILETLQAESHCPKRFACVYDALENLCQGQYHPELDIMECLDKTDPPCHYARTFGCTQVCTCPLRKFIAKNFDKWSDETTSRIRQAQQSPET